MFAFGVFRNFFISLNLCRLKHSHRGILPLLLVHLFFWDSFFILFPQLSLSHGLSIFLYTLMLGALILNCSPFCRRPIKLPQSTWMIGPCIIWVTISCLKLLQYQGRKMVASCPGGFIIAHTQLSENVKREDFKIIVYP